MFLDFFADKKVLITGHTGFKGSWLCQMLLLAGADVSGYSLPPNTSPALFSAIGMQKKMKNHFEDIRNYGKLFSAVKKEQPEIIIHMAAQPLVRSSYDDPLYTFETNVMGTANILEAARKAGNVKSVVVITTDKVYENKEQDKLYQENDELGGYDPYASSKVCAEHVARSYTRSFFNPAEYGKTHHTLVASARAGNVIGGGDWSKDRIIPDLARAVFERKEKLILRNPTAVRPWQHVLEPLAGYLILAERLYKGDKECVGAWNFAPEKENHISVEELVRKAMQKLGQGGYEVKADERLHETAMLKLDATKSKKKLGWKPVLGVEKSLDWTVGWYKAYYGKENVATLGEKQIREYGEMLEAGI